MTETERLVLEVQSKGMSETNRRLDDLDRKTKAAERSGRSLRGLWIGLSAAAAAVAAAVTLVGGKLVNSVKTYQDFNAQLKIATGSAKTAGLAFEALQDFAATTPYSVDEATQAFIKLKNLGLTPSEQALRSYGNTASSMGKSLNDFIEAVADASTNEFERLKEFGIKSSKEGEKVTFTFQGIKTTVAATSKEIEGFLIGLGEQKFAGAMEERMKGLSGKLSNLGDAWEQMWQAIGKSGVDNILVAAFGKATDAVSEFTDMISSGEMKSRIKAYGHLWGAVTDLIGDGFDVLTGVVKDATSAWMLYFQSFDSYTTDFWRDLPVNAVGGFKATYAAVKNTITNLRTDFARWFVDVADEGTRAAGKIGAGFDALWGRIKGEITDEELMRRYDEVDKRIDAEKEATAQVVAERKAANDKEFEDEIERITFEANKRIQEYERYQQEAEKLREEFELKRKTRMEAAGDRLATLIPDQYSSTQDEGRAKASPEFEARIKSLEQALEGEDRVLMEGYERQRDLILDATNTTEQEKTNLIMDKLRNLLLTQEEALNLGYIRQRDLIMAATNITERDKSALVERITLEREQRLTQLEQASQKKRLDQAGDFFGNIASIGSTFGKKGFEIAKAAAIAQATIKTYESATSAYAALAGIPYVGPALGAAAAAAAVVAGAANIAQIKAQQYTPLTAYAHGGMVPAGKYGLVGEAGPEIIRGPAVVTSAATTASKQGANGVQSVTIQNYGSPADVETKMNGDELMVVLRPLLAQNKKEVKTELASEIRRGGGSVSQAVEGTYGLNRGRNSTT